MSVPHYTEIDAYLAHYKDMRRQYIVSHGWSRIDSVSHDENLVWYTDHRGGRETEDRLYNELKSKDPLRISNDTPGASHIIYTATGPVKFYFAELFNQTYWKRWV